MIENLRHTPPPKIPNGMCMLGGIYTHQKCPRCGTNFKDNGKTGLVCPNHPVQYATRFEVKIKGISKRFKSYEEACRFLIGMRFKIDENTFDKRDYQKNNPLGFTVNIEKWLVYKKDEVKPKNYTNIKNYANKAMNFFKDTNIKEIGYAELEDFIHAQKSISRKTKSNILSSLHNFWVWLKKRKIITNKDFPEFPVIKYELGYRNTVPKETQNQILDEIYRISYTKNPKIWLGIKFLCTYISIRPGELIGIQEKDIDIDSGYLRIPHPKEKRYKSVPLINEDIELLRQFPKGLPDIFFFRHVKGSGQKEGTHFGKKVFYNWWKKACTNLGIGGVDLYGGTRHSTAKALRSFCTPEEIKRATMHSTNKAFERYYRIESDEIREVYSKTRSDINSKKSSTVKGNLKLVK